jgi:hypothetical protein
VRHVVNLGLNVGAAGSLVIVSVLAGCSLPDRPTREQASVKYDPVSGRLRELAFDTTQNGRNDSIGFMDGTQVQRIEVDENEDGKVDRWEFYDANRRLERAGFSRQRNGVLDAIAFYGEGGEVERVEMSTRGDGLFNRIEFYRFESLARVEEDTNGDGRIDKWETYTVDPRGTPDKSPPIATASFDDSFRGTPTRRLVYRPDGTGVLRVEVDPDGDGIFEESTAPRREQRE